MAISPNDFSLWARLTGNKYPSTPAERAKKGPEVHNFIQNLDKEGMLGGKEPEQPKKEKNLAEKVATGALIAGGVAAAVAAGRDPRVQNIAKKAASATRTKIDDFLSNLGKARVVDVDIVDASGDVTPDPRQQQSNIAPQLTGTSAAGRLTSIGDNQVRDPELGLVTFDKGATPEQINNILTSIKMDRKLDRKAREGTLTRKDERQFLKKELTRSGTTPQELFGTDTIDSYLDQMANQGAFKNEQKPVGVSSFQQNISKDNYTPLVKGETFFTEGAISKEDPYGDISNLEKRVDRTYGNVLNKLKPADAASTRASLVREARKARDFDLGYINAMARGRTDEDATITGRKFGGYDLSRAVRPQTPYREALSELKIASTVPAQIDDLLKLVETGPQINLPESVQEPGALVQLAAGSTPSNKVPTMGATIGGSSLTDQHATEMAVDNALDRIRAIDKVQTSRKTYGPLPDVSGPVSVTGIRIAGPSNVQKSGPGVVVDKEGNVVGDANYRSGQRELPIVYSTERETNQQMRRIEPTAEQSIAIRQEQGEVSKDRKGNMMITSPTYDSLTGFKTPSSETVASTPLEERIGRLESKTAELRAIQENLSRAGELMSSGLDPRTTRFDSARAAGLTSRSGITPRITNPKFQENVNLGRTQEAALPKESQRVFFEQDESGKVIPQSVQLRDERQAVTGPDTKTRGIAGGYVGKEGQGFIERRGKFDNMPEKEMASSIGPYGVEAGNFPRANISQTPTESPMSFTQAPGRAKQPIDIVVSGGRGGQNKFDMPGGGGYQQFKSEMDNIIGQMGIPEGKTINILSGGATGVDSYAARYAGEKRFKGGNFTSEVIEADWTKGGTLPPPPKGQKPVRGVNFDPAAGPVRNQKMINKAEAAIVFDGGKGTEDFIGQAQKEQAERRFPIFKASEVQKATPESKERFDVAREVTRFLTDQSIPPEKRVLNDQARNELVERVRNRRALNLPTNLKQSPFFYQNGD